MRYVTVCENEGEHAVPGCVTPGHKATRYAMRPGLAWRLNDETKDHEVVEIKEASKATYTWTTRWIDGRTVAVFLGPNGKEYAQPVAEDSRARERRLGTSRKLRKARREAPGVAPEAPAARAEASEEAPAPTEPRRRRRKVLELLG